MKKAVYLRQKVHSLEGFVLDPSKPPEKDGTLENFKYSMEETTAIEDELKSEISILKKVKKIVETSKSKLGELSSENGGLLEQVRSLKESLEGEIYGDYFS